MNWVENWPLIVAAICCVVVLCFWVYRFMMRPSEEQIAAVKEWLLLAVTMAEKQLGGGTGKLKLRQVYDLFLQRFPYITRWISFGVFSEWVDDALAEMKKLLTANRAVQDYVAGGVGNDPE